MPTDITVANALSPEAMQVLERASNALALHAPKPDGMPETPAERKRRRELEQAAKLELMDGQRDEKQPGFSVNKDVLAGICHELSRKFEVPDVVASRAVMTAYHGLQEEFAKQTLTRQSTAMHGIDMALKSEPAPAVPVYPSLDNEADNTLTNRARNSSALRPAR